MKKTFSIIIALCSCCISAFAYGVSPQEARDVAAGFFGLAGKGDRLSQVRVAQTRISDGQDYYIFNRQGGGYVIISGDNSTRPVLGYSDTGTFPEYDELPDNLRWWLEVLSDSVRENRRRNVIPDMKTIRRWNTSAQEATRSDEYYYEMNLNTVQWHQNAPFNSECPLVEGGRSPYAGCLPIAVSEIMCYYGWPEAASGYVGEYYNDGAGTVFGGFDLGTVYDWASIQNATTPDKAWKLSSSQRTNLAKLISDVGQTANAYYSTEGTAASNGNVVAKVCGPFGYNKAAKYELRSFYDEDEWEQKLINEISQERPIFYTGEQNGGHAFVIDGFRIDMYGDITFHINFGWGPSSNGYFWIGQKYYGNQCALFDFVPDRDGSSEFNDGGIYLANHKFSSGQYSFMPMNTSYTPLKTIEKSNKTFYFSVGILDNDGNGPFWGSVKLVHLDKNGAKIEDVSDTKSIKGLTGYYSEFSFYNCKLQKDIYFGDKIGIYTGSSVDPNSWRPIRSCRQGECAEFFPLTPYPFIDVMEETEGDWGTYLQTKSSYSVGEKFYLRLRNNNFPYVVGAGNNELFTEWRFFLNGELKETINDYSARSYTIPEAGDWMVIASVKYCDTKQTKLVLSALFKAL